MGAGERRRGEEEAGFKAEVGLETDVGRGSVGRYVAGGAEWGGKSVVGHGCGKEVWACQERGEGGGGGRTPLNSEIPDRFYGMFFKVCFPCSLQFYN